jgi:dUTPase
MEILTENDLFSAVENETFIKSGKKESCEGIKYDFILSRMILTPESGRPQDIEQVSRENSVIKPGEIAFVMTEETLDLPNDIYCQLSAKRKLSLDGIVILGGLIIDPNYKGKLIFGLYNLSSRNYPLLPGRKLVAGVFYKVDKKSEKHPEPINNFPDELIKIVVGTKPNSINSVNVAINEMNTAVNNLRLEMQEIKKNLDNDEKWKTSFKENLTDITNLVKQISENLDKEVKTRTEENLKIRQEQFLLEKNVAPLSKIQKRSQFFKGSLAATIMSILVGLIVFLISKFIG